MRPVKVSANCQAPWPVFEQDERDAVERVLVSGDVNYWTGNEGRQFESEFAVYTASRHAVALSNGTVALEAALAASGVGPGDEVITSSRTFIASASAVAMRGAIPVCADVDRDSQNVTAATIAPEITPRTRAIIVVHLAGWPCEMDEIVDLAVERNLVLIEDCAQAIGARYRDRPVGCLGDVGTFSFCQDKIMSTGGEGGMLVTNDNELWSRAWSMKDHGKDFATVFGRAHAPGFRWLHESFGTNWRMTELQAAIGRAQLQKIDRWVAQRTANAEILTQGLDGLAALRIPRPRGHLRHAWYKFYAFVEPDALKSNQSRDSIMAEINDQGVPCFSGSCSEIYREKAFRKAGLGPLRRFPIARELGDTSLMFLVHPTLSADSMRRAVEIVRAIICAASR